MSDFKPIETQEQFDSMIKDRLEQAERSFKAKYGDMDALKAQLQDKETEIGSLTAKVDDLNEKLKGNDTTISGLKTQVQEYETASVKTRIAHEEGLPFELAARLSGADEEAIRADAKTLASMLASRTSVSTPQFNPEPEPAGDKSSVAWNKMVNDLGKGEF